MNSVMKLCTAHFFICGPKISPRAFHLWCNAASRRDRGGDVASSDRQSVPHQPTHVSLLVLRALEGEHAFVRYRPGRFNARTHAFDRTSTSPTSHTEGTIKSFDGQRGDPSSDVQRSRLNGRRRAYRATLSRDERDGQRATCSGDRTWLTRGVLRAMRRGQGFARGPRVPSCGLLLQSPKRRRRGMGSAASRPDAARRGHREPGG